MLLSKWGNASQVQETIQQVLPDYQDRVRFSRLLRELLHEGVPITNPARILQAVGAAGISTDLEALLQAVRLSLKDLLPGAQPGANRVHLSEDLEWSLRYRLETGDGGVFLIAPPGEVQEWLNDLSQLTQNWEERYLVVKDMQLRKPLARLLEMASPGIKVLSEAEVAGGEVS
jgi:flagellar biosynthesis component FlhA